MSPVRIVLAVGVVGVIIATAATLHVQQTQREEELRQERIASAASDLQRDVRGLREGIAEPAHAGRNAAASLRILVAEAVTGWDRDDDTVLADLDRRVEELEDAADRLAGEAAATELDPAAQPEGALPVTSVEPIATRVESVLHNARATATHLRAAAATSRRVGEAAHDLHVAATRFVDGGTELPDSNDPDDLTDAWREGLERLEPYREAAEEAASVEQLAALAAAHLHLVQDFTSFAETALDHLEAEDVDAYNEHREAALGDVSDHQKHLVEAMELTLGTAVQMLEDAEEHALGLLHELEALRRDTASEITPLTRG